MIITISVRIADQGSYQLDYWTKIIETMSRGYNNNNPLNIRHSPDLFRGQVEGKPDKAFKTFTEMAYGFRAAFALMRTYMRKYNLNTTEGIIKRWAPPNENDTKAYIRFVCTHTGKRPTDIIYFRPEDLIPLVLAMAQMENGEPANKQDAERGWELL